MVYLTVRPTSGGYHGHQLKDLLGGITVSKVFSFKYVHTYYPYLEFFGLGVGEMRVNELPEDLDYIKIGGPFWNGINYENAQKVFLPLKDKYKDKDCLVSVENALRIFPHQTIKWLNEKLIDRNVFEEIASETTNKFRQKHLNMPTYFNPQKVNIAMHISRGMDYDKDKFPEHFNSSHNVRYMFPIGYYENIVELMRSALKSKEYEFHIYTEKLNSEDVVKAFSGKDNVILHLGDNRDAGNNSLIHDIFYHFVQSDILVTCNSSFSAMASYFRRDKITVYHPHDHLENLPGDAFIETSQEGNFDGKLLYTFSI